MTLVIQLLEPATTKGNKMKERFADIDTITLMIDSLAMKKEVHDRIRRSELFKQIQDHITSAECVLVGLSEKVSIMWYRGTGPGIRLTDFHYVYERWSRELSRMEPDQNATLDLEIMYCYAGDKDMDFPPTHEMKVSISVPTELLTSYSRAKFDKWIKDIKEEKEEENTAKEHEILEKLITKYPEITGLICLKLLKKKTKENDQKAITHLPVNPQSDRML